MNKNIQEDFQICISVPLKLKLNFVESPHINQSPVFFNFLYSLDAYSEPSRKS